MGGPNYVRPSAPVPAEFKEAVPGQRPEDWKLAEPRDGHPRGAWWEVFGDPELDALEVMVDASNQDVARAEANYRVARALARGARAELLPTISTAPSINIRNNGGGSSANGSTN